MSDATAADLMALTLAPSLDELPQDVLVHVLLACDTTSIGRLVRSSVTLAHCCEDGRVWEAVWRRQFGAFWALESNCEVPIPAPQSARNRGLAGLGPFLG